MKVYKAPLFFGKPLQDVLLLSDFEKDKKKYFDDELQEEFHNKYEGKSDYDWFVECFGVEK